MLIKIICIVALLEFSISEYDAETLPMDKDSKYGDDVCHYTDKKKKYVKPCEKGKFCDENVIRTLDYIRNKDNIDDVSNSSIGICREFPKISPIFTFNERGCTNDFECESPYKCIDNVCTQECPTGKFLSYAGCRDNSEKGSEGEICYELTINSVGVQDEKYSPPNANKECGKIVSFADNPLNTEKGIYYVNKKGFVYPGEVEDGEYVTEDYFCKSGFALYFFKDGKTEDPRDTNASSGPNQMHLRCVTPISISSDYDSTLTPPSWTTCLINYKIKEDGEILRYNVLYLPSGYSGTGSPIDDYCSDIDRDYIKLKSEKYREFYTKISEEERKTCGDLDDTNKYTCENNGLIKLWYSYTNPKDYLNYNDRKKIGEVLDYKIQQQYPCYSLSQFLSIKFIYLLFLLFF